MKRRSYLLCIVVLLTLCATVLGQEPSAPNAHDKEKPSAPDFSVTSLQGEKFQLAALRGKIVVLNFWFTGCAPCVAEFDELNRLVKKFKDKGVTFIAPTLDDPKVLKPFLKEHKFKYHIVPNAGGLIVMTYSDGSGNVVFPTHIVIDRDGKVDTRVTGAKGVADLRKAIARLTDIKTVKEK